MSQSTSHALSRQWSRWFVAAGLGVLTAATLALWAHYGTAVFYEMMLAGLNACF